ncbi:MAG TPA: hypothetical protein VFR84_05465 [Candidatus Angelobacter sp.]|nr:hypothetical protein [Candidatus Angelobacter sp.]
MRKAIVVLAVLLFSAFGSAQQEDSKSRIKQMEDAAWARAGCGPDAVRFDVKMDKHQHALAEPESGKAVVYVFEDDLTRGMEPTTRVGVDGKWMGGNVPLGYMSFPVAPGTHRLCSNWQGTPQAGAALDFTAEAGKSYFFHAKVSFFGNEVFRLEQVPDAQGHFLIASHGRSTSAEKSRNQDD